MNGLQPVAQAFFARPVLVVARDLLGAILVHHTPDGVIAGAIVEAEAYAQDDPGSHASRGETPRNKPMFEESGRAYVYLTYGMHHCLNAVTDQRGVAGAVLIRAVEPLHGIDLMRARRDSVAQRDLARGPGRLTKAFGIDLSHNRADLSAPPLMIAPGERLADGAVVRTPRIGLGRTQDGRRWRFAVRGSSWVSGPRSLGATGSHRS
jgi:DNA-3-methyladenine glycosylase